MKEQLLAALQGLITTVIDAKNFLVAEIPDVIREILMWAIVSNGLVAVICAITFYFAVKYIRITLPKCGEYEIGWALVTMGLVIVCVVSFFVGLNCALDAIKAWLAPKLFLIEYAVDLVKTCSSCGG